MGRAASPSQAAGRKGELELEQARAGTHARMVQEEKRLRALQASRISRAQELRDFRLAAVQDQFNAERRVVEEEFAREKGALQERLGQDVIDRQRRHTKVCT